MSVLNTKLNVLLLNVKCRGDCQSKGAEDEVIVESKLVKHVYLL